MSRWVLVLTGLFVLACSGLTPQEHALDARDHAVLVEGAELAALFDGVTIDPTKETWSKSYSLGSWDVEYTYKNRGFYMNSLVTVHDTVADADTAMWAAGLGASLVGDGVRFVEQPDLFTGGDVRKCGLVVSDAGTVGNFCTIRTGTVFTMFSLVGVAAEGPGELDALLGPAIAAMAGYVPKEAPLP